ncbi:MAG: TldD/PmbA family protein [Methanomassiliicoccus sp.]|nr:TldD/PmbA family protein [Methanomassiliicoccus sp.]
MMDSTMLKEMVDLALSKGAGYAEIRFQKDSHDSTLVKNGTPEVTSIETDRGVSMRAIVDGGLGFGATSLIGRRDLRDLAVRTVKAARAASRLRSAPVHLGEADLAKGTFEVRPRVRPENVDREDRLGLLQEVDREAGEAASRGGVALPGRYLSLDTFTTEKHIITSDGADLRSVIPRAEVHMILTAAVPSKGSVQRSISLGESGGWEAVERWDLVRKVREEVGALGKVLTTGSGFKGGSLDVVLGPEVVGIIAHESAGHPGEADRMLGREAAQAGETYLGREDIGRTVGSGLVNVVDDPTLERSFGRYMSDDEGVKASRRYLIRDGRIEALLHNRETAAAMGAESNGSSRSVSFDREPIVRMANTFVEAGDHGEEEIFEDVRRGIYMRNFMEWNIDDRRFNQRYVGLEAYLIVDGELGPMVRNPVLEITTPALWSAVDAVGKEVEFSSAHCGKGDPMQAIPVWTGGPRMRLRNIWMGGSA